jgi:hypothetical protein
LDDDVPLARALKNLLTACKLALLPDREERHAASRLQSRIDAGLAWRPIVIGFAELVRGPRPSSQRESMIFSATSV